MRLDMRLTPHHRFIYEGRAYRHPPSQQPSNMISDARGLDVRDSPQKQGDRFKRSVRIAGKRERNDEVVGENPKSDLRVFQYHLRRRHLKRIEVMEDVERLIFMRSIPDPLSGTQNVEVRNEMRARFPVVGVDRPTDILHGSRLSLAPALPLAVLRVVHDGEQLGPRMDVQLGVDMHQMSLNRAF